MKRRAIIIGLDGVPFGLAEDFSKNGIMPNMGRIIENGTFRQMASSIPEVSSVAWSSIITGANPGEHAIFGFTDFPANTYRLSFTNFNHLKIPPFWEKDTNRRHIIVNVPSTYPARELNGVLISGFVAPNLEKAVYPDSIISHLKDMDYRFDVDSSKAHQSLELFVKDLNRTNETRISVYRHLWDEDWDVFMLVFTGTDRLMHFLWDAYEDSKHDFHQEFIGYFRRVDEVIGEIIDKAEDNDNIIIISDHGFERLDKDVYINYILKTSGYLKLIPAQKANFSNIDYSTKAFALDPARIYVNLKDRYPRGSISSADKKYIIDEIKDLFNSLEINGRRVIKHIFEKDEIYKGSHINNAPDLVLLGNEGFNLKASLASKGIYSRSIFTGKHTQHDAFLLVNRRCDDDIIPEYPSVCDVVKIMDKLTSRQSPINQKEVLNER